MRMHRKSHLDERLLSCSDILTSSSITEKNMKLAAAQEEFLNSSELFHNENPLHLEIGCGKGKFACLSAEQNPDINFIAVEKISNVLIEALESAKAMGLKNLHFINCPAEVLQKYIKPDSVSRIYLNFSNPLPKEGYKKQRLTHPKFLNIYRELLKEGGEIFIKTDDEPFYQFSLESLKECNFSITFCTDDYKEQEEGDIQTEHEAAFRAMGRKIHKIKAVKN